MSAPTISYRCDHFHLRSRDAAAAARFYIEALDAREVRRDGTPVVSRVTVDLGGVTLFIEQAPDTADPTPTPPHLGIEHIGLAVHDIDAAMASLRSRGVKVVADVSSPRPGIRMAFIDGPDAVRIELVERS